MARRRYPSDEDRIALFHKEGRGTGRGGDYKPAAELSKPRILEKLEIGCQLRQLGSDLIGHLPPLRACRCRIILRESSGDEGRHDTAPALAGMGKGGPGEMHPAPLPRRLEDPGDDGFDAAMGVGDQLLLAA